MDDLDILTGPRYNKDLTACQKSNKSFHVNTQTLTRLKALPFLLKRAISRKKNVHILKSSMKFNCFTSGVEAANVALLIKMTYSVHTL